MDVFLGRNSVSDPRTLKTKNLKNLDFLKATSTALIPGTPDLLLLCFRSMQFLKTNISQGSVATSFRFGGICNGLFIANFLLSITADNFKNRSTV